MAPGRSNTSQPDAQYCRQNHAYRPNPPLLQPNTRTVEGNGILLSHLSTDQAPLLSTSFTSTKAPSAFVPRPLVSKSVEYGNRASWWVEYPSGLIDLTRTHHLAPNATSPPPLDPATQFELPVDGKRTIRVNEAKTAFVIIDMQHFFLNPELLPHPWGLAAVDPILSTLPGLRANGVKILWVNWGLTDTELSTIAPSLLRGFWDPRRGSFGSQLPGQFGRLLMRGEHNSDLYGPLQDAYLKGKDKGTDVWIHKNRMSGLWGPQTDLHLYLEQNGIETLLFGGVNSDQCVLGTVVDAYSKGFDCVFVNDAAATNSPAHGHDNVVFNVFNNYGFTTDTARIVQATS